eukprot:scaffold308633_cov35-Tisochrysis_lutea.AAC.1
MWSSLTERDLSACAMSSRLSPIVSVLPLTRTKCKERICLQLFDGLESTPILMSHVYFTISHSPPLVRGRAAAPNKYIASRRRTKP